jgi:DNA-binding response OmpR family regulator
VVRRVLIVEDDPDIAECLRYSFERADFQTRLALTGTEGLSASLDKEDPPVAIVLDLLLPGINGLEICRRVRSDPATRQIPVVMVTAKGSEADLAAGLNAGADCYLTKPFSIREVIERVRSLLHRSEAGLSEFRHD